MIKSHKGLTLIETIAALSIFVVITSIVFPLYSLVQNERLSILQAKTAMNVLELEWYKLSQTGEDVMDDVIEKEGTTFYVEGNKEDSSLCISWRGANHREGEKCIFFY